MTPQDLTDAPWERLQPLLPPQQPQTARPHLDHRRLVNGILWRLRTAAPWRHVPERDGSWHTVASRFSRWRRAGTWQRLFESVQQQADTAAQWEGAMHDVEGTIVGAHQQAAGSPNAAEADALGRSQGGFSTKIHWRAAGDPHLMTLVLTPGQRHEAMGFEALMASGAVQRSGQGRAKQRPGRVGGDKASSSRHLRGYWRRLGIRITMPHTGTDHRRGPFDRALYRLRERVERLIHRRNQHRRIATRYDECAEHDRAMWLIAATRLW